MSADLDAVRTVQDKTQQRLTQSALVAAEMRTSLAQARETVAQTREFALRLERLRATLAARASEMRTPR